MGKKKKGNKAKPRKKMPTAYILMTKYKDGDPEIDGVFSSFEKAVKSFVGTEFMDEKIGKEELLSKVAQVTLKMAHKTDDEDYADFGDTRAWIEEWAIDGECDGNEEEGE